MTRREVKAKLAFVGRGHYTMYFLMRCLFFSPPPPLLILLRSFFSGQTETIIQRYIKFCKKKKTVDKGEDISGERLKGGRFVAVNREIESHFILIINSIIFRLPFFSPIA